MTDENKLAQANKIKDALAALISAIVPDLDSGDILSDARAALDALYTKYMLITPIGLVHPRRSSHDLYTTGDADSPDSVKDRNGDVTLGLCKRGGGAEDALTAHVS